MSNEQTAVAKPTGLTGAEKCLFIAGIVVGVTALAFTIYNAAGGAIPALGTGTLP